MKPDQSKKPASGHTPAQVRSWTQVLDCFFTPQTPFCHYHPYRTHRLSVVACITRSTRNLLAHITRWQSRAAQLHSIAVHRLADQGEKSADTVCVHWRLFCGKRADFSRVRVRVRVRSWKTRQSSKTRIMGDRDTPSCCLFVSDLPSDVTEKVSGLLITAS